MQRLLTVKLSNPMLGDYSVNGKMTNTERMMMMLLTSGKRLSLSVVILLTPRDGLWSALKMISGVARYQRSSYKLVEAKSA